MKTISTVNISFEFFPPKTSAGQEQLQEAALELAAWHPQFFSVTFGAGGSTRDGTIDTVRSLQQQTTALVAPHLACIGARRDEIKAILQHYQALGVRRIVALRGDLPSGMGQGGEFKFAYELVAMIREVLGDKVQIDVAAYPEIHPQAESVEAEFLNLKRKMDAGATGAITQYFFNADAYFAYQDACVREGITLPLTPGIMPITQFNKLARFSDMCGAEIPRWIRKRLESYGDDLASIQQFGLEVVHALCERLIEGGAPGLHFYTLNKADATIAILQSLGASKLELVKQAVGAES